MIKKEVNWLILCLPGVIVLGLMTIVGTGGGGPDSSIIASFIEGKVSDADSRKPIEGALIETNVGCSDISDLNGRYLMVHQAGMYTITASATGYSTTQAEVVVPEGGDVTQDFELTPNHAPDTPILSSPDNGQIDISLTPELQTGAFSDPDSGDTHAQTQWQVSTQSNFSSLVLDVTSDSHLISLTVPEFIVTANTTYYWRAKFFDSRGAASEWSDPYYSFTTIAAFASDDTDSNGIPDDQENEEVDLDGNGEPDYDQDDMKSVNTVVGEGQVGVKEGTSVTSIDSIKSIDPDTISDTTNKPDEMPLGIITFKVTVDNPGDIAEVVVYLSEPAPIGAKWYKYDTIHGWQDYSAHATFSLDSTYVTLALKDGDYGDCDGTANGVIVDPSGHGVVNQAPTASFTADPVSGEASLMVSFDATASSDPDGTIDSYVWGFGDGNTGSNEVTVHNYTSAGTYKVILTVTDNEGETGTAIGIITVTAAPIPPDDHCKIIEIDGICCFIATAAYGSYMEPHVKILREFRDRFMLTNPVGKVAVDFYYNYSPPVADFIANHDTVRLMVRWSLLPLVGMSWMSLNIGFCSALVFIGLLICFMGASATIALKRMRIRRQS